MGIKITEVGVGGRIIINISSGGKGLQMGAVIKKIVKDSLVLINLEYPGAGRINFGGVNIEVEYYPDGESPVVWNQVKIASYQGDYALQVMTDGARNNRRSASRIVVSKSGRLQTAGKGNTTVTIRDVSISGFSISDVTKSLKLSIGKSAVLTFDDLGYKLELSGSVVRVEEREDRIIYGFIIQNLCKNLPTYISAKRNGVPKKS